MATEPRKEDGATDGPPDWSEVSTLTGIDTEKLQNQYADILTSGNLAPSVTELSASGDGTRYDVTIVPGVLSVKISADFEAGENWRAKVEFTPKVFGHSLPSSNIELSRLNSHFTIHPGMAVAKADLTIGVSGPELWFGVTGEACHFGHEGSSPFSGWGWICTNINSPHMFRLRP